MKIVVIVSKNIKDSESLHKEFKEKMKFFDGYGMNMDAWIDSMSQAVLNANDSICIEIQDSEEFIAKTPESLKELVDCSAFVNNRLSQMKIENSLLFKFV